MIKFFFIAYFSLCFYFGGGAQISQRINLPVVNAQKTVLQNAFAGGINAGQFSNGDFNNDGRADIFVFDRIGNIGSVFLATGAVTAPVFVYSPEISANLPALQYWALVRDYNGDGVPDIFTYYDGAVQGIQVYRGSIVNGVLQFKIVNTNYSNNVLNYNNNSGNPINIYVNSTDIPVLDDVDGDGDFDILCFGVAGEYVTYYKNNIVEKGFGTDGFILEKSDDCWGRFLDNGAQEAVILGKKDSCANQFSSDKVSLRHPGATLTMFDANADGLPDLIVSSISFNTLSEVINGGTKTSAWMTSQITNFPPNAPAVISTFPAGYFVDTDGDGVKELAVCTNSNNISDDSHVLLYKKTGTAKNPTWLPLKNNFLTETMLDFGTGSNPACADVNADGLTDIIVGNYGYYKADGTTDARLTLLKNIGTATNPSFEISDTNYLQINKLNGGNYSNLTPTFVDIDGDGDLDLIVGENNGSLLFFENIAGANKPFQFKPAVENWLNLKCGVAVAPTFFDLNNDGVLDLICGRQIGLLDYYQNVGTKTNPKFNLTPTIPFLGKVDVRDFINGPIGFSMPQFFRTNNDIQLLVGAENGSITAYKNIQNNLNGTFTMSDSSYLRAHVGSHTSIAFGNFLSANTLQCIIGNFRGGLSAFGSNILRSPNTANEEIHSDISFSLSPNPTNNYLHIDCSEHEQPNTRLTIYTIQGQQVFNEVANSFPFSINIGNLVSGTYILQISSGTTNQVIKFVKSQ